MERRKFLQKSVLTGLGCSCLVPNGLATAGFRKIAGTPGETPCNEKVKFAKTWASRFFKILDDNLDEETLNRIMHRNGEACYSGTYGELTGLVPRTDEEIEKSLDEIRSYLGKDNPQREGNIIYFQYVGNPQGLKISDGYCLCPLLENGPAVISHSYCQCSVGYVDMMFRKITGRKVKVDLLESLRSGGKSCRFKITIES